MKAGRIILHIIITLALIILTVGVPSAYILTRSGGKMTDAVSGASMKLPEKTSGEYLILVNRSLHEDTIDEWTAFFRDEKMDVIFDDINCIAPRGDGNAIKTAERLRAQLPENQMRLRSEDATLLASKAENGCIDAAIFSKEFADELKLKADAHENVVCIKIRVGEQ